jgi:hypothetical protein
MAIVSPTGLLGARSPIYISWDGTGTAEVESFTLEVYAWTGDKDTRPATPIYTISRTSGFVDIYPVANIAPLLRDQFNPLIGKWTSASELNYSPNSFFWVEVDYEVDYNNGGGTLNSTGTTTRFMVCNGYTDLIENANKDLQQGILWDGDSRYMGYNDTHQLPVYLGPDVNQGLDIIYGYEDRVLADGGIVESLQCANIGLRYVKVSNSDGTSYQFEVSEAFLGGDLAQDRVVLFPAGPANLTNWKVTNGKSGSAPYDVEWYDMQLMNGFGEIIDERRVYSTCEPKYDPQQVFFVNKLGAWDSVTFFKRRDDSINITKSSYKPNIGSAGASGYTYADTARTKVNYNYTKENRVTLNTGFVEESCNDVIEQLLMSETIYMVQNRTTNRSGSTYEILQGYRWANVVTESLQMQKHINDKTINYVIEFEFNELEQNLVV